MCRCHTGKFYLLLNLFLRCPPGSGCTHTFCSKPKLEKCLVFIQAVIHEIQRVANTVPLSVFHCTTKDTELMGYSIPKGTMIIENLTSVLSEEGQWKFRHEFNPENFLDDKGEFVKPEAFMPFSAGPRVCLGEGLARMELFLMMVTLLRKFKFIWPEDAGEPDFTPVYGVTLTPKPYRMKNQLRTPQ
uniref:Cytochrome P450, family 2, subfamily X, polypeptide 9 n=1 Tax=Oreochromis niloticus TaxID=8128 RepID=A0A669F9Z3_ORENI